MTKIELLQALESFHKQMNGYSLFTFSEPFKIIDTKSYMYKYFDENDKAVACFSYTDFLHLTEDNNFVQLNFDNSNGTFFNYEQLMLIIKSLPKKCNHILHEPEASKGNYICGLCDKPMKIS
jgi:hypothetical protein